MDTIEKNHYFIQGDPRTMQPTTRNNNAKILRKKIFFML